MSLRDLNRLKDYCEYVIYSIKKEDPKRIEKSIKKLENLNKELMKDAKEFNYKFTLFITQGVEQTIFQIRKEMHNPKICINRLNFMIHSLDHVEEQPKILKEMVSGHIKHLFKKYGYKRRGINFIKETDSYTKKAKIWSSRWNNFEHVEFTIEVFVEENKTKKELLHTRSGFLKGKRDTWYVLTPHVNVRKLESEVLHDIERYVIPTLENYTLKSSSSEY